MQPSHRCGLKLNLSGVLRGGEPSDRDLTLRRESLAMRLDAMEFMKGGGCEVATSTPRTTKNRNVLYKKKIPALTVAPGNAVNAGSFSTAEIANGGSVLRHDTP